MARDYCADVRVYLIRNPGFNASMAPNGMMQAWTGLLLRVGTRMRMPTLRVRRFGGRNGVMYLAVDPYYFELNREAANGVIVSGRR